MAGTGGSRLRPRAVWRSLASTRVRLLLSVGLVLGFGTVGTLAYWADTATVTSGAIRSGSLDLQLGGRDPDTPSEIVWQAVGLDTSWEYAVAQLDNVAPGESVAMELWIRNVGTTPLTFTGVGASTTNDLHPHLWASTRLMGDAVNTGTRTAVDRTGSCANGTQTWWDKRTMTTSPSPVTPGDAAFSLAPSQVIRVCMLAGLGTSAPGSYQGRSTTIKVVLAGKQAGGA